MCLMGLVSCGGGGDVGSGGDVVGGIVGGVENEMVRVDIAAGSVVESPLLVTGEARGVWFFEGVFPVELVDADNVVIAKGLAQAKSDYMTDEFVEFEADLSFVTQADSGTLILKKDNPSGLPENDAQVEIPVKFGSKSLYEI